MVIRMDNWDNIPALERRVAWLRRTTGVRFRIVTRDKHIDLWVGRKQFTQGLSVPELRALVEGMIVTV